MGDTANTEEEQSHDELLSIYPRKLTAYRDQCIEYHRILIECFGISDLYYVAIGRVVRSAGKSVSSSRVGRGAAFARGFFASSSFVVARASASLIGEAGLALGLGLRTYVCRLY